MKMKHTILLVGIFFVNMLQSQNILTQEEAIKITLENNYDILVSKNDLDVAKNNASIYNSGYLPSASVSSGANYSTTNSENEAQDGVVTSIDNAVSKSYNASVGINYTIFDGFNRKNTYKKLQEAYGLTELQARQIIENAMIQLYANYFEVARLTENNNNQKQSLDISKQRLQRANYSFEYGQNTKLDVLNAEVDVNNDSINVLNSSRLLVNAKRDLNVTMGRDVSTIFFDVETEIDYKLDLTLDQLLKDSEKNNASILQTEKNINITNYNLAIDKSGWMPNVSANANYSWNKTINDDPIGFSMASQQNDGINAGLSLGWNLFDGGKTKTRVQNSKIQIETQEIFKQQQLQLLKRDVNNAWETYQNALFTLGVQESNVLTNERNFDRTKEQYKLGQVNSIDFRQAQINLLNANLSWSQSKYDAKNSEYQLLYLAGILLN
ncbi:MAG: TolC family protein [Flavobacteriaceae bacterium]|nr:TolC family protein [Flavobacteriaceae bacterium]